MKLNERYIETWHEDKDYHIYQVTLPEGKSVAFILEGAEKHFIAAFDHIDNARDAICGWPEVDQEGNQWKLEESKDGKNDQCREIREIAQGAVFTLQVSGR